MKNSSLHFTVYHSKFPKINVLISILKNLINNHQPWTTRIFNFPSIHRETSSLPGDVATPNVINFTSLRSTIAAAEHSSEPPSPKRKEVAITSDAASVHFTQNPQRLMSAKSSTVSIAQILCTIVRRWRLGVEFMGGHRAENGR